MAQIFPSGKKGSLTKENFIFTQGRSGPLSSLPPRGDLSVPLSFSLHSAGAQVMKMEGVGEGLWWQEWELFLFTFGG